ncbi:MAG: hypothetical protein KGI54_08335 [Pseudomonadota bacterium]|nr:hypothetical protein [Pseudomonadota bacterium]
MANLTLGSTEAQPVALTGVNVIPVISYDWDVKNSSTTSAAVASDFIRTPTFDLNQVNPNCNRVSFQKLVSIASADVMAIQMSADGTNWYTAPLFTGFQHAGDTAASSTSVAELSLAALPAMRYIRGSVQLTTYDMSARTSMRLAMSFLRH